jgi:HAD superfamily hydrolase (TIGR01509 family)
MRPKAEIEEMYDLIIFDCDGVLIDSEWLASQVEIEELNRLGFSISMEEYLDIALGTTDDEVERQLLNDGFQLPFAFWKDVQLRQEKEFAERLTPISGVKDVIQNLLIPHCVASSSDANRLKLTLSITGLFPLLEGRIFGRECVKKGKPEPDIFLYAAAKMGAAPSRCLVIEDSMHGIKAAQAACMEVWGFCGGRHFTPKRKAELNHAGVRHVFDDMKRVLNQINAYAL